MIEFRNVSYAYGDEEDADVVLKAASFRVVRGQTVFLSGANGAGKSTSTALFSRKRGNISSWAGA